MLSCKNNMSLIRDYFNKTVKYKSEHGDRTLVLMQVGAFYEVYGLKDKTTGEITGSDIEPFSHFCDLNISDKKVCVGKRGVVMAGFRDYVLEKYLRKIVENNYTAVVYSQDEKAAGTTRSRTGIYSPGTFFNSESIEITNNSVCIWIQKHKDQIICGMANIDIYTGKSSMFEYQDVYSKHCTSYDEMERFISIYNPSEVIIIHNLEDRLINNIINFASIKTECIHKININETNTLSDKANNCEKQIYQKKIIEKFYNDSEITENFNFYNYPIATQSLCFLLEFIYEHNPDLVHKIALPTFENCNERLILGNHSLKQLNIINSGEGKGKVASVARYINMCVTPMGRRKLNQILVAPTFDIEFLKKEYDQCEYLCNNVSIEEYIRTSLKSMKDLEKLSRKLILKRITPSDLYYLHNNIVSAQNLFEWLYENTAMEKYIESFLSKEKFEASEKIINLLSTKLNLKECQEINNLDYDKNFINAGVDTEYDQLITDYKDSLILLETITNWLNLQVAPFEKNSRSKTKEYVKIYQTDKMGYSIIATKRRALILKEQLKKQPNSIIKLQYKSWTGETKHIDFDQSKLEYGKSTSANWNIESNYTRKLCKSILTSHKDVSLKLESIYKKIINELMTFSDNLNEVIQFVAIIDSISTKSHIATKYNLSKPIIDTEKESSFLNIKGLRHILIEAILENELYVTNDINLDNSQLGILLYGTNAVGKSSFIKSIGIAIIMAQSGFFVPCSELVYQPYKTLFTRIIGNDDIFKSLSTYAVEMLELKTIIDKSDEHSLILGDELCHGTETTSAKSIVVESINTFYNRNCNFIFATHYHEIRNWEEITGKENFSLKHMSITHNKELDQIIYNRKIKDGPGEAVYGLEVLKGLHYPSWFINNCYDLRTKYNEETKSILDYKSSHFNAKKIKGMCQLCKKTFSSEVHHLQHQEDADENGFIGGFHKNHIANLLCVCDSCHDKLHNSKKGHEWKLTSSGYQLQEIL